MNRRNFLQKFGLGVVAVVIAPTFLEPVVKRLLEQPLPRCKLKATWTIEAGRDIECYFNEKYENELIVEINKEIDTMIINDFYASSKIKTRYKNTKINNDFYSTITIS